MIQWSIILSTSILLEELSTRGWFGCTDSEDFSTIRFGCGVIQSHLSTSDGIGGDHGILIDFYRGFSKFWKFCQEGLGSFSTNIFYPHELWDLSSPSMKVA